jgi:carbonic anhydrase/acetyltransferase-like protein (isoleucine patch superfamily)
VVDPTAYVAPNAVLCGDVRVGARACVLFGAVLTAEDGHIEVGARCVIMEHAVLRGRAAHPVLLGDDVLVGPHAHLNGTTVGDGCFLATGCSLFPASRLGREAEVRINGVVHVNTVLEPGALVPIGWVAVGDPARIFPPGEHEEIWRIQECLDFPGTVYGISRAASARERMERQAAWFAAHRHDRAIRPGRAGSARPARD